MGVRAQTKRIPGQTQPSPSGTHITVGRNNTSLDLTWLRCCEYCSPEKYPSWKFLLTLIAYWLLCHSKNNCRLEDGFWWNSRIYCFHYSHHWGIVISEEICFSTEQVWQEAFKMMDNFDNRPQVRINITYDIRGEVFYPWRVTSETKSSCRRCMVRWGSSPRLVLFLSRMTREKSPCRKSRCRDTSVENDRTMLRGEFTLEFLKTIWVLEKVQQQRRGGGGGGLLHQENADDQEGGGEGGAKEGEEGQLGLLLIRFEQKSES